MTILEAWQASHVNTARINYNDLLITVNCIRIGYLTVIFNGKELIQSPEQFGDFCRILDIDPQKGWSPV